MKNFRLKFLLQRICLVLSLGISGLIVACDASDRALVTESLNSLYTDEQPALSGNGRFVALVSNRNNSRQILLYDLQQQLLMPLPRLNRRNTIVDSPSLSYTGRYIVYIASDQGKPSLMFYDRATQQAQNLSQWYQGWVRNPSISPDGRYIAFESGLRGQWDIEVLDRGSNVELDIPDGVATSPVSLP